MARANRPAHPDKPTSRSSWTLEEWSSLLAWIESGEPLAEWCRAVEGRPKPRTVRDWAHESPERLAEYDNAYAAGMDALAHRARKTIRGFDTEKGGESTGDVQRDKAIVDLELKLLAKWDARYRDRVQNEVTGKEGGPIEHAVAVRVPPSVQRVLDELAGRRAGAGDEVPGKD